MADGASGTLPLLIEKPLTIDFWLGNEWVEIRIDAKGGNLLRGLAVTEGMDLKTWLKKYVRFEDVLHHQTLKIGQ